MTRTFSIDPARVERLTSRREALFEVCRQAEADKNDKIRAIHLLETEHAQARATVRRWVAPPSEIEKLARLKAEFAAARLRVEATSADAQNYDRLASAVTEYAKPRPVTFGGAMIKGISTDGR